MSENKDISLRRVQLVRTLIGAAIGVALQMGASVEEISAAIVGWIERVENNTLIPALTMLKEQFPVAPAEKGEGLL